MTRTSFAELSVSNIKVAIVSSYGRNCGIAQYVEHLEAPLRALVDALDIVPLPVDLLRASGKTAAIMARGALDQVLRRIALADVVVIEFEPGLFGRDQGRIWWTIKAILAASKRVIITYHTAPSPSAPLQLTRKGIADHLVHTYRQLIFGRLLRRVRSDQQKFVHIVQTSREKYRLTLLGIDPGRIYDMPLAFLALEQKARLATAGHRAQLDQTIGTQGRTLLGAFGFLGGIKGISVALNALSLLHDHYHLLVVGGIHPESVVHGTSVQPALGAIYSQLGKPGASGHLRNRVHFTGSVDNQRFSELMAACDAVLLPYEEVGQTSSGPASLALDLQRPIYCTRTGAFSELGKYAVDALSFFEIGNHFELAQKIASGDAATPRRREALANYAGRITVEHRARLYVDAVRAVLG